MRNWRLNYQILLIALMGIIIILGASWIILSSTRQDILDRYVAEGKSYVDVGYGLVKSYDYLDADDSNLNNSEEMKLASSAFQSMHFGRYSDTYYFVFDGKGVYIAGHDYPLGTNVLGDSNDHSQNFQKFMSAAQNNADGALIPVMLKHGDGGMQRGYAYVRYYKPWNWYIGVYLYSSDVQKDFLQILNNFIILIVLSFVVTAIIMFIVHFQVVRPVIILNNAVKQIVEKQDIDVFIPYTHMKNEIGLLAQSLERFKVGVKNVREEREKKRLLEIEYQQKQNESLREFAVIFQEQVGHSVADIYEVSNLLRDASHNMLQVASKSENLSQNVLSVSDSSAGNVQSVASATEELSASISEITSQVGQSTEMTGKAVSEAQEVNAIVNRLNESAMRVGEVVDLISSIAEQTNLLALNATIEAARAGDAGRGFSVVASEVKNLASRTAKATEEISIQINEMQKSTRASVDAIGQISDIVMDINRVISSIAAAVEEQSAATQEISRNAEYASAATQETRGNVQEVLTSIRETNGVSDNMMSISSKLQIKTEDLQKAIDVFLSELKKGIES